MTYETGASTNAEKRDRVDRALNAPDLDSMSNRALARRLCVSHELVARRRALRSGNRCQMSATCIVERRGSTFEMRTGRINAGRGRQDRDQIGQGLPAGARVTFDLWTRRLGAIHKAAAAIVSEWDATRRELVALRSEGQITKGQLLAMEGQMTRVAGLMRFHLAAIAQRMPFAACATCGGVRLDCSTCGGLGWLDHARHDAAARGQRR